MSVTGDHDLVTGDHITQTQCSQEEVFCTSYIVAHYLKHILNLKSKVYLLGMPGFVEELDMVGIKSIGYGVSYVIVLSH